MINSFAEQIETRNSRVDLGKIIGINAFSLERMAGALDEYESEEDDDVCTLEGCTHDHEHGHGHADAHGHSHAEAAESEHGHAEAPAVVAHTEHGHAEKPKKPKKLKKHDISGVSSVGLTSDVPLNSLEFNKFMHGMIKDHKENLYRP